jgi:hypothetical protein
MDGSAVDDAAAQGECEMATNRNHEVSRTTLAAVAVGGSILLPVATALAFPAQAALLAPLALAVPFISMSLLESAICPDGNAA